jgi:hypothetical protein
MIGTNWLVHLMKYLRGTRTLPMILSANGTSILKWWVDAAFAVHPNMQGHSGGGLSLGRGFPIMSLTKFFLEKNGKASSSKHTKHVNIWYFFMSNHIDKGNVSLVWCPTGDMIRDFMTKPLQGALFWKFRDQIMGVVPAQDPGPGKAITKINELNTHTVKPTKGKELKPSRGKSQYIIWSHLRKKDGTTGVCWEK